MRAGRRRRTALPVEVVRAHVNVIAGLARRAPLWMRAPRRVSWRCRQHRAGENARDQHARAARAPAAIGERRSVPDVKRDINAGPYRYRGPSTSTPHMQAAERARMAARRAVIVA